MKILHCLAQLPMKTGSGVYFSTLVEGMIKKGHENAVLYGTQLPFAEKTFNESLPDNLQGRVKEYPVKFLSDYKQEKTFNEDLPFPIAGMSDIMPYTSTVYSEMSDEMYQKWISVFEKNLLRIREEFNPDVIISHHLFILTSLVKKIFPDKKIIGISHGTDIRQIKQNPWIKERYIQNLDKLDLYFTVSPKDISEVKNIFSANLEKIKLAGGGFNPDIFNDKNRHVFDGTFRLCYAGKISDSKGVFELAKTLPLILKKYPNTELTLVGNASEEQKAALLKNAGYSENLKIENASSQICMCKILKQNDIFILPSYYEALGLVAVEALACGLFAVTTEIEGLINLLGEKINTSGLIEFVKLPRIYDVDKVYEEDKPAFVEALAEKIMLQMERLKSQKDFYSPLAEEIKKHSWDSIIDRIEKEIRAI
ncbi:glycosyltransferase family 4 protein [Treponema sp. OMZ 788]|uniref:glycosyltransferase family 4 protein n=1 Tax=Treponema sp. OMZ 788 TaxID=2563664 RepID=UPI0020A2B4B0|nr:glycosyltransferase family 4 protein [Treponema sp. OMZ 788]UTC64524.1 glycosyltransferase family 4 protein [Treponema sp. OMZ 788]